MAKRKTKKKTAGTGDRIRGTYVGHQRGFGFLVLEGGGTDLFVPSRKEGDAMDGDTVLACETSPRGPLGFVMWLDNQYMVVTPWGRFRYGWVASPGRQWMEVDSLSIEPPDQEDTGRQT